MTSAQKQLAYDIDDGAYERRQDALKTMDRELDQVKKDELAARLESLRRQMESFGGRIGEPDASDNVDSVEAPRQQMPISRVHSRLEKLTVRINDLGNILRLGNAGPNFQKAFARLTGNVRRVAKTYIDRDPVDVMRDIDNMESTAQRMRQEFLRAAGNSSLRALEAKVASIEETVDFAQGSLGTRLDDVEAQLSSLATRLEAAMSTPMNSGDVDDLRREIGTIHRLLAALPDKGYKNILSRISTLSRKLETIDSRDNIKRLDGDILRLDRQVSGLIERFGEINSIQTKLLEMQQLVENLPKPAAIRPPDTRVAAPSRASRARGGGTTLADLLAKSGRLAAAKQVASDREPRMPFSFKQLSLHEDESHLEQTTPAKQAEPAHRDEDRDLQEHDQEHDENQNQGDILSQMSAPVRGVEPEDGARDALIHNDPRKADPMPAQEPPSPPVSPSSRPALSHGHNRVQRRNTSQVRPRAHFAKRKAAPVVQMQAEEPGRFDFLQNHRGAIAAGACLVAFIAGSVAVYNYYNATSTPEQLAEAVNSTVVETSSTSSNTQSRDISGLANNREPALIQSASHNPADQLKPAASAAPATPPRPPAVIQPAQLRAAAAAGDPQAQFVIGTRYLDGVGVGRDLRQAAIWYEHAANQGYAPAQYRLGSMYEKGRGVTKDADLARIWYQRAIGRGNVKAMHNLGVLYAEGAFGEQDLASASQLFAQAAKHGLRDSQYNLGILNARGLGVPKSLPKAYQWFSIVARDGDTDAATKQAQIANDLDPQMRIATDLLVNAWKPEPINLAANKIPANPDWDMASAGISVASVKPSREMIMEIQALLINQGYQLGRPDGIIGPKTQAAIRAFQQRSGLPTDGQVSKRLLDVLRG